MKTVHAEVLTTVTAQVTDTNRRARGAMKVAVDFLTDSEGRRPSSIRHDGVDYYFSRRGTNLKTGAPMVELCADEHSRIWSSLDATVVIED